MNTQRSTLRKTNRIPQRAEGDLLIVFVILTLLKVVLASYSDDDVKHPRHE